MNITKGKMQLENIQQHLKVIKILLPFDLDSGGRKV
jgi:hypothetical protein